MKNIIVYDDDRDSASILEGLMSADYRVHAGNDAEEALAMLNAADLIILGMRKNTEETFTFIERVRALNTTLPVLIISYKLEPSVIITAHKLGIHYITEKPYNPLLLLERVQLILKKHALAYEKPDPVTGLHKKLYAEEQLADMLDKGQNGALILIEVDRYQYISSKVDDKTLLKCRDVVFENISGKAFFALSGIDGFILFIPNLEQRRAVERLAETIIKNILKRIGEEEIFVAAGLAVTERHGNNYTDLYKMCDLGLDLARQKGKNTACFYNY